MSKRPPANDDGFQLFPIPLGRCALEPGPFRLSVRSQFQRVLRPERLVVRQGEWSTRGVTTLAGLFIEGFPLSYSGPVPAEVYGSGALPVRLETAGLVLQRGQLLELRGDFRLFDPGPLHWSRRAGPPPARREWPPRYWSNLAGSLWPSFEALLLVRQVDEPLTAPPIKWPP